MNGLMRLFEQRVRGIRLIELVGGILMFGLIFWVCISKAREGEDVRRMNELDRQIAVEQEAVNSLKIKVAQLERPGRLEQLAVEYLGMKPTDPNHEARLESLGEISRTTSQAVSPASTIAPPPARPAPVSAPADDLITVAPARKAPEVASQSTTTRAGGR
ncbi:cell division protein FtsL [Asticcacaulis sp.]|uniref:cell division protein FtsL n=1 Tax=Asticcacaulis sp. TaxID=1872648 RepID=UPI002CAF883C|nr:septum formation inhibitor MinC [Asticcacaulis sp.]HTM80034.1 septum formation inhibitor MinC [Asticcacaulis sp.]